jgi:glycosyltransferase involved in cell wall biosynthesis
MGQVSMKLCFVCSEYPPPSDGVVGSFTQTLARGLARRGHQVRVIGVYPRDRVAEKNEIPPITDPGIKVTRITEVVPHVGWIHARCQMFRTIARWSRQGEIDLVETPDAGGWASGWGRLPVPVIVRLHGSRSCVAAESGQTPDGMTFRLEKESLRRADFWCASSVYAAEKTKQLFGVRTEDPAVLHPGVEVPFMPDSPVRLPGQVLFAGTLAPHNALVRLLNAWPMVVARCPHAQLRVMGCEDLRAMEKSLLGRLDESMRRGVSFWTSTSEELMRQMLRTSQVAVFSPYAEMLTVSAADAMAWGCPTISTGWGAAREWMRSGSDGLLADLDDPAEVAAAIVQLLTDAELAHRLGAAGRKRVEEYFSVDEAVVRNEEFYRDCLARFHRPSTSTGIAGKVVQVGNQGAGHGHRALASGGGEAVHRRCVFDRWKR